MLAKVLIEFRVIQGSRLAPWMLGACIGRWPKRIKLDQYTVCENVDCEKCNSLAPGAIDLDDETEIKHDPFGVLRLV